MFFLVFKVGVTDLHETDPNCADQGKRLGRAPAVVDLGAAHKLRAEGLGLRGTAK